MNKYITNRVLSEAKYLVETKKTIREIAIHFKVSKSTVHKDMQEKLKNISKPLYDNVRIILDEHLENRHIKGGETTKQKYQNK